MERNKCPVISAVRLVNWHGYTDKTFLAGEITLIYGKNAHGKSAFLDALAYGLIGDTDFNAAAGNGKRTGKRTLVSYNRKLIDYNDDGTFRYERDPGTVSYILIQFGEGGRDSQSVLGTAFWVTTQGNNVTRRFIVNGRNVASFEVYSRDGERKRTLPFHEFSSKNGISPIQGNDTEALLEFAYAYGFMARGQSALKEFRRRLSIGKSSYRQYTSTADFIIGSVLRPGTVKTDNLKDAHRVFAAQEENYRALCQEIDSLGDVISAYKEYDRLEHRISVNKAKKAYEGYKDAGAALSTLKAKKAASDKSASALAMEKARLEADESSLMGMVRQYDYSLADGNGPYVEAQKRLRSMERDLDDELRAKEELDAFSQRVGHLLEDDGIRSGVPAEDLEILKGLLYGGYTAEEKETSVNALRSAISSHLDKLKRERYHLEEKAEDLAHRCEELERREKDLGSSFNLPSRNEDYILLRDDVNREFEKRHIDAFAYLVCDCVADVDEEWRDVIEAYLGRQRYAVLVSEKYHHIAYDIWVRNRAARYRKAELINTVKLAKIDIPEPVAGSLYSKLSVENSTAEALLTYRLGHIVAVKNDRDVRDYENAISPTGAMEMGISERSLDLSRIGMYALGRGALEKNLENVRKELSEKKREFRETHAELLRIERIIKGLPDPERFSAPCSFDIARRIEHTRAEKKKAEEEMARIESALASDIRMQELLGLREEKVRELDRVRGQQKSLRDREHSALLENASLGAGISAAEQMYSDAEKAFFEQRALSEAIVREAIEESDGGKGAWADGTARDNAARAIKLRDKLIGAQSAYRNVYAPDMPEGPEAYGAYQETYSAIMIGRREDLRRELERARDTYEGIVKNEVILSVYNDYEKCVADIKRINKRLASAEFPSSYRLVIKKEMDPDTQDIFAFGEMLSREEIAATSGQTAGQEDIFSWMEPTGGQEDEEERWGRVKKIFSDSLQGKGRDIDKLCDYREYIRADVEITDRATGKKKLLSRFEGKCSGGEGRVPRFLLTVSALQVLYDDCPACLKLIMIDEPFEKIDQKNVDSLMEYVRSQGMQAILCTATPGVIEKHWSVKDLVAKDERTGDVEVLPEIRRKEGIP